MDELQALQDDYMTKLKRLKLLEQGLDYESIDTYVKYLTSDNEKELEQQAQDIAEDVRAHINIKPDVHHDKRTMTLFND